MVIVDWRQQVTKDLKGIGSGTTHEHAKFSGAVLEKGRDR
jgi:hypothetical protein